MRSSAKIPAALRDELGDLLFQVVFHSQMARSRARSRSTTWSPRSATSSSGAIRMSSATRTSTMRAAQTVAWEEQKTAGARATPAASVLDDVPLALPALTRANKLGKRAALVGFEWPDVAGALDKLDEELGELRQEVAAAGRRGGDHRRARRRAVLRRQCLPLSEDRSGNGAAWRQREVRAALPLRRTAACASRAAAPARRRWRRWTSSGTRQEREKSA